MTSPAPKIALLLVEDNEVDREATERAVRAWADVTSVDTLADGLERLVGRRYDCVLLDLGLPDSSGPDSLSAVLSVAPRVPVVVLTGADAQSLGVDLVQLGAQDYLPKGQISPVLLSRSVRHAMERQRVTSALKASEARYRTLMEHASCGLFLLDGDGSVLQANEEGTRVLETDADRIVGARFADFFPADAHEALAASFEELAREGHSSLRETVCVTLDGQRRDVTLSATHVQSGGDLLALVVISDVSAVKQLRDQLLQSQKMEAVGRLAGGVAHDFNNLLTVILSFARYVYDDLPNGDPRRSDISEILAAGERASTLTRQLLAFSRKQPTRPRVVGINDLLVDVQKMLARSVGEDVRIHLDLAPALWPVRVDPRQLEQVVMNLSVNSRDAMPAGGDITITTRNEPGERAADDMVLVSFADTGGGIPRDVLPHIFQPFYTTKEPRRGTGLGLAMCYGIVKQAGGDIKALSDPGVGTTFEVRLPRTTMTAQGRQRLPSATAGALGRASDSATILLVEDEELVRKAALRVLERAGYHVLDARNGAEAMAHAMAPGAHIDLLLGDVVMPDMSGMEVAARVLELHPEMRVLFMTGYAADFLEERGISGVGDFKVLQKPFLPDKLLRRVARAIETPLERRGELFKRRG